MSATPRSEPLLTFELEIVGGPHAGQTFSFQKASVTIGRGTENTLVLADDLRVSRQHAEIKQSDGMISIVNTSQKNYILVNGTKVQYDQLQGPATLIIGESEIRFRMRASAPLAVVPRGGTPSPLGVPAKTAASRGPQSIVPTPQSNFPAPHSVPSPHLASGPAPLGAQSFQAPRSTPGARSSRSSSADTTQKMRMILIAVVVGLGLYFYMFENSDEKKKGKSIRTNEVIEREMKASEEVSLQFEEKREKSKSLTNKRAMENFVKGFRDYQNGQYLRAREYFRIVLNLNPEDVEARRYFNLSQIKYEKQIEQNYEQGLRYKSEKNYRLCVSYFSQVMILIQNDRTHRRFDEVEKYLKECNLAMEGRM